MEHLLNVKDCYLKLTIYDNDFGYEIKLVSELLRDVFCFLDIEPVDLYNNLAQVKEYVQYLLYATSSISHQLEGMPLTSFDYFKPDLEIVPYRDIPDWDNGETAFIPLFEGDIIYR